MFLSRITKKFIVAQDFKADGLNSFADAEEKFFRPRKGMKLPPTAEENSEALRIKILELFGDYYNNNFIKLESACSINENTMRKYLKGTRKITRAALAKFCIGTKLTVKQSE